MATNTRSKPALLAAGALSAFLIISLLAFLKVAPVSPTVIPQPATPAPAAAVQSAPQAHAPHLAQSAPTGVRHDYIVQAASVERAREAVIKTGGVVTGELEIIRAVGAALDDRELASLWNDPVPGLCVYDDATVSASGAAALPETYYPTEVGANTMHNGGLTGRGVTVAVLDSGLWREKGPLQRTSYGRDPRVLAQYDVILARENPGAYKPTSYEQYDRDIDDVFGHGTHVSSVIASSGVAVTGRYQGVAPGVNLVSVRVLDRNGAGRYFDVIRGIQWVVTNRARYGVRILNLSLSGPVRSHYWDDPLNQAVMAAWSSGIVVVAAAGNSGPAPMSIGVPGNVPYVITVGAVTDNYQPFKPSEYRLASFSSAGPTYEGFVKPEVVAMGGHIRAYAPDDGALAQMFPQWVDSQYRDFTMSGTSQAAAVTSGVVALMLDVNPYLTPDQVKCRLMDSARPAVKPDGSLAYSVFQQGAGLVNARDAAYSTASGCANQGLNVWLDLSGLKHFGGRANQDPDGNFYIMEVQGPGS
jgi:serine protease AprX